MLCIKFRFSHYSSVSDLLTLIITNFYDNKFLSTRFYIWMVLCPLWSLKCMMRKTYVKSNAWIKGDMQMLDVWVLSSTSSRQQRIIGIGWRLTANFKIVINDKVHYILLFPQMSSILKLPFPLQRSEAQAQTLKKEATTTCHQLPLARLIKWFPGSIRARNRATHREVEHLKSKKLQMAAS